MFGARSIGGQYLGAGRAVGSLPTPIAGSGSAVSTGTGQIGTGLRISAGVGSGVSTGAGTIRRRLGIGGAGSALASGAGSAAARIKVAGAGSAIGSGQTGFGVQINISGAGSAVASGEIAVVARRRRVTAAGSAVSSARSIIGRRRPISGTGNAIALGTATDALSTGIRLSGAGSGIATGIARFPDFFAGDIEGGRIIEVPPRFPFLRVDPRSPIITVKVDDEGIMLLDTKFKQPQEVVDYVLDMEDWFQEVDETDYIVSGVVSIDITGDPDDLEAGPAGKPEFDTIGVSTPQLARIWLGGGRDGIEYKVTILVTTNGGRVEELDLPMVVEEL